MAQIPKYRSVEGPYQPICRDCAMYFSITIYIYVYILYIYMYIHSESTSQIPLLDQGIDYANQGSLCRRYAYFFSWKKWVIKYVYMGSLGFFLYGIPNISENSVFFVFFLLFVWCLRVLCWMLLWSFWYFQKLAIFAAEIEIQHVECVWSTYSKWRVLGGSRNIQIQMTQNIPNTLPSPSPQKKHDLTDQRLLKIVEDDGTMFLGSMARPWVEKVKCHGNSSGVQLDVGERLGKGWGGSSCPKIAGDISGVLSHWRLMNFGRIPNKLT